jgi:hypothetical protein
MARSSLLLGGLLGLLLAAGLGLRSVATLPPIAAANPVYSARALRAGVAQDPAAWLGRTVRVRGIAVRCSDPPSWGPHCLYEQPQLLGRWGAPAAEGLPLDSDAAPPPLVGALRQLPLLGRLMPAPQVLRWGAVATYRVRLQALTESSCGTGACFEAVLLDAAR